MDGNWARGGHFFFIEKCVTRNQASISINDIKWVSVSEYRRFVGRAGVKSHAQGHKKHLSQSVPILHYMQWHMGSVK